MIGILLLLIALYLYFRPRYRFVSLFLYLSFMIGYNGGFGLWTNNITGIKNGDLAVIYTFVISLYLILTNNYALPKFSFIRQYKWLILFFICSILFSLFYYEINPYYVLQGARNYLLLFSLPILCNIRDYEFRKLMKLMMWITVITSVLYIMQIIVGRPLMPYGDGSYNSYGVDSATGLVRLYNSPVLNVFFLALSFIYPDYYGKKIGVFRAIFFISLMCTLGRTGIFSGILTVCLAAIFHGKNKMIVKMFFLLGLLFLPFADMIGGRFERGETKEDLQSLLQGNAISYEYSQDGGTMTYRIALLYERIMYLSDRPIGEKIFGLGLITDSYPKVFKMYNFHIGLYDPQTGRIAQMVSPDIAYANLICHWGFIGTIFYLIFAIALTTFLLRHRKDNPYLTVAAASSLMLFINSISGSRLSDPSCFIMYFLIISTIMPHKNIKTNILNKQIL